MRTGAYTGVAGVVVATVLAIVLSGCAARASEEPTRAPTSAATPTPTKDLALALDCATLASNDAVSSLLGVDAGAIDAGIRAVTDINRTFSQLEAAGGGSCLWGSPEAADIEKHGATADDRGAAER